MAFFGRRALRRFPDYETLPYEPISPPQDLLADRLLALLQARARRAGDADRRGRRVTRAARRRPSSSCRARCSVATGDRFDPTDMTKRLSEHGYLRVEQVAEPGEFAVRGAVLRRVPHRQRRARFASTCSTTRSRRCVRSTRRRSSRPAARTRSRFCRRASFRSTKRRSRRSASASASTFPSSRAAAPSIARSPTRSCRPASSTTCRCSFATTASLFDYLEDEHAVHRRGRRLRNARRARGS